MLRRSADSERVIHAFQDHYGVSIAETRSLFTSHIKDFAPSLSELSPLKSLLLKPAPFGDYIPYILRDLAGSLEDLPQEVKLGWLSLYYYTIYLDKLVDREIVLEPADILLATYCFQSGLERLTISFHDEGLVKQFSTELKESLLGELSDIAGGDRWKSNIQKNRCVCAFNITISHFLKSDGMQLSKISSALLQPLQLLDDIDDMFEDYCANNRTPILHDSLFQEQRFTDRRSLLLALIKDGSLVKSLNTIKDGLEAVLLLAMPSAGQQNRTPTAIILSEIVQQLKSIISILESVNGAYNGASILDEIDKRLALVAVGSL